MFPELSLRSLQLVLLSTLLWGCHKGHLPGHGNGHGQGSNYDTTITVTVDRTQTFQTIDGFGFFGAKTPWWSDPSTLYSKDWADQVINDLGITIWRNEYYPPGDDQDASWEKQRPVVEGLAAVAQASHVPLKFIFTVWSPPADLKCEVDENNQPLSGVPHPEGTKKGGTLDPAKYADFAHWLTDGIELYAQSGINLYAISPQNEPLFVEDYNSCYYYPMGGYAEMLKNVVPLIKAQFPDIKIFGAENMLEIEAGKDRQWFYNTSLKNDPTALANLDIWAMHGYQEGISPTNSARLPGLWQTFHTEFAIPSQKPVWMTETSGYSDDWVPEDGKPGALDLASDIQSALYYGQASAWIWWQGSDNSINEYSLMAGDKTGKKYYASKQFYRFIRPGAQMVQVSEDTASPVLVTAFQHPEMHSFTIVLVNGSTQHIRVKLSGRDLPQTYDGYLTTADAQQNCQKLAEKVVKNNIVLPPLSVTTLVQGNVFE